MRRSWGVWLPVLAGLLGCGDGVGPSAGEWVAFLARSLPEPARLMRARPDGTDLTTLTPFDVAVGTGRHWDCSLASGEYVVAVRDPQQSQTLEHLLRIRPDGAVDTITGTFGYRVEHVRFSPDGRQLAFVGRRDSATHDVWLVPAQGGTPGRLSPAGWDEIDATLAWSPDGGSIAYLRQRVVDGTTEKQLVVQNLATRAITVMSTPAHESLSPAWSPDGTQLVVAGAAGLLLLPADGGAASGLTEGHVDESPAWFPDGAEILFVRDQSSVAGVSLSGGVRPVFDRSFPGLPRLSPDGSRAVLHAGPVPQERVYVWNGRELREMAGETRMMDPRWCR